MTLQAPSIDDTFRARGAIATLFRSDALEIVVGGPAGTGKTRGLLEYLNYMASAHDNCRLSLLRKTRRSLTESAMVTFEQKVLHPAQGVRWESAVQRYHYPNGSIIAVGGLDKPSKIMSSEWDIVAVPEATELQEGEWEALTTRLRNGRTPRQQIIGDCNPDAPTHWIRQRAATGKLSLLESHYEDNPTWWQDSMWTQSGLDYLAKLDELTGVRLLRLRHGIWAAAEGMVYQDAWDRQRCLLPRTKYCRQFANLRGDCGIDPSWPRYIGIDWGYRNPTVVKWYARLPDGQLLVYRELYQTMTLVEDIARAALSAMGWEMTTSGVLKPTRSDADPLPREIIADHDAEDRATFERYFGMSVYPADKGKDSINIGIQAVTRRLQESRLQYLEGSLLQRDPLLESAKKPCSSLEEFESYVWDTRAGRKPKEIPIDDNNHGCFVAGTMVETANGPRAIETVAPGTLVLTRKGYRRVLASGMTQRSADVMTVAFSDGRTLTATPDHPLYHSTKGYIELRAIRYGDTIETWEEARAKQKSSSIAALSSGAILNLSAGKIASTICLKTSIASRASSDCIKRYGKTLTARFRTATRSTTRTTTRSITPSTILRFYPSRNTGSITQTRSQPKSLRGFASEWVRCVSLPAIGTAPKKVASGIRNWGAYQPRLATTLRRLASSAAKSSRLITSPRVRLAFAPITANLHGGERSISTTSPSNAQPVALSSRPINTSRAASVQKLARAQRSGESSLASALTAAIPSRYGHPSGNASARPHVLTTTCINDKQPVYNLTVDGEHEFYANGFLVHNCDVDRYVCLYFDHQPTGMGRAIQFSAAGF